MSLERRTAAWSLMPLAACAALAAGCSRPSVDEPPPAAGLPYQSSPAIAAYRAQKDLAFRTDPDSPIPPAHRPSFQALSYYPVSGEWQFRVKLHRFPGSVPFPIVTTGGKARPADKVGYVEFPYSGRLNRLYVYSLKDLGADAPPGELFLPFLDATSGVETYGAGRYLELAPGPPGWYVLDFNLAYHPLCAYGRTDYWCPRTPEENRLPFPVRAGEQGWANHAAAGGDASEAGTMAHRPASGGNGG